MKILRFYQTKTGLLNGPDIRKLMRDQQFDLIVINFIQNSFYHKPFNQFSSNTHMQYEVSFEQLHLSVITLNDFMIFYTVCSVSVFPIKLKVF